MRANLYNHHYIKWICFSIKLKILDLASLDNMKNITLVNFRSRLNAHIILSMYTY